jgi:hypothetical protein
MKRETPKSVAALVVACLGGLVLSYTMIGLTIWQGWDSKPVNQLPVLFWVVYAITVLCGIAIPMLIWEVAKAPSTNNKRPPSALRIMLLLIGVLVFLPPTSSKLEWDEAQLLYVTAGLLLSLLLGVVLSQRFLGRRESENGN